MSRIKPTPRKKKMGVRKSPAKMPTAAKKPNKVESDSSEASNSRFVNDLLIRNEAAERDADGKVPLTATHVIEKKKSDGAVQVKRVRFKLF